MLVVLARNYREYILWAREKFPYSSPQELERECLCIKGEQDVERLRGLRRGQMFVDIGGGTQYLRDFCHARTIHEIHF